MFDVIDFDFDKLEVGMELMVDMANGVDWRRVTGIYDKNAMYSIELDDSILVGSDGRFFRNDEKPSILKMRYTGIKKASDVPTIEYNDTDAFYVVIDRSQNLPWLNVVRATHETYGTKYYTLENARLTSRMLIKEI